MNKRTRLPPLDALRGFEAAARLSGFAKAAAELNLTPSAISRQVKALEDDLGVRLFARTTRRLDLTPAGERLARAAAEALATLAAAAAELRAGAGARTVYVSASIGVASLWLVPRLADFQAEQPDIDVRLSVDNRVVDLARSGMDMALRYGPADAMPPDSELLFGEEVFPVGSRKAVGAAARRPMTAADYARATLLSYDGIGAAPARDWNSWLAATGMAGVRPRSVLSFNHYDQVIQAAVAGQGLALGSGPLVGRLIAEGRLVAVAGARRRVESRAYFLVPRPGPARPEAAKFAAWVRRAAAAT
jgi:DNA-binding transcriptional LysR family regulator